jgi:hypothetical protein
MGDNPEPASETVEVAESTEVQPTTEQPPPEEPPEKPPEEPPPPPEPDPKEPTVARLHQMCERIITLLEGDNSAQANAIRGNVNSGIMDEQWLANTITGLETDKSVHLLTVNIG